MAGVGRTDSEASVESVFQAEGRASAKLGDRSQLPRTTVRLEGKTHSDKKDRARWTSHQLL